MNPSFSAAWKPYVAALGQAGRLDEAAAARHRLLAIEPDFTIERFMASAPFEREGDRERYAAGLRLAGIPERDEDFVKPLTQLEKRGVS